MIDNFMLFKTVFSALNKVIDLLITQMFTIFQQYLLFIGFTVYMSIRGKHFIFRYDQLQLFFVLKKVK